MHLIASARYVHWTFGHIGCLERVCFTLHRLCKIDCYSIVTGQDALSINPSKSIEQQCCYSIHRQHLRTAYSNSTFKQHLQIAYTNSFLKQRLPKTIQWIFFEQTPSVNRSSSTAGHQLQNGVFCQKQNCRSGVNSYLSDLYNVLSSFL